MTVGEKEKRNKCWRGRKEGRRDAVGHLFKHKYLCQRSLCQGTNYAESAHSALLLRGEVRRGEGEGKWSKELRIKMDRFINKFHNFTVLQLLTALFGQ